MELSHWPRGTLYTQTLALTSPKSGGYSVGTVRSPYLATEFSSVLSELYENIVEHFPANWIIGFLEVYE
jgi:hypothetical protein